LELEDVLRVNFNNDDQATLYLSFQKVIIKNLIYLTVKLPDFYKHLHTLEDLIQNTKKEYWFYMTHPSLDNDPYELLLFTIIGEYFMKEYLLQEIEG